MNSRECGVCGREMTAFTSQDDKKIFMCPCCGGIYLPVETRDKRIIDYEYSYGGTFIPSGDIPTCKQASYIKVLCNKLNLEEVDIYSMTKEEARNLISELKEKVDANEESDDNYYIIKKNKIRKEKSHKGKVISVVFGLGRADITDREWLENYKNNLHPNDDWTNVNIETYAKHIVKFDREECLKVIDDAMKAEVVGYVD